MEIQWPLVLFTLFSGMGGCMFFFVGLNEFTRKSNVSGFAPGLIAGILAIIGGIFSVLHLAHVDRIMNALSHPTSGIFIEAVLIGCLCVCILIYLICLWRKVNIGTKIFAVLGMASGLALTFMAGHSYMMEAIESWNTMLLPIGYLCSALPMGSALYWAIACKDEKSGKFMAICTLICGILGIIGTLAYTIFIDAYTGENMLIALGSVILAGVVPTVVGALGIKYPKVSLGWIAFASATLGALLYRILMWVSYAAAFGFFGDI